MQAGNNVESTVSCPAVQCGMQCKLEKMLKALYTPRRASENQRHAPENKCHASENQRRMPENQRRMPETRATRLKTRGAGKKAPQPRNDKILRLMTKYCEKYYNYSGDI